MGSIMACKKWSLNSQKNADNLKAEDLFPNFASPLSLAKNNTMRYLLIINLHIF